MPSETYNVGCYLLDRLQQIGCNHLFGVPGDYNLRFLDDVMAQEKEKNFKWIGCANELNAAYAADGYGKCKGIAAMLTTFGVGELSALNGIAGAMAEHSPVVHIVGGPATDLENKRLVMHHTLGEGNFRDFIKMSEPITCAQAVLYPENAAEEIDRVLQLVMLHKRPGFILLPADVAVTTCEPPTSALKLIEPPVSDESVTLFEKAVKALFESAKEPALLAGFLCDRYRCNALTEKLVTEANIAFGVQSLGKSVLDETLPQFVGTYFGLASQESTKKVLEGADVIVHVGVRFHDYGSSFFSQKFDLERTIDIQPFGASVGKKKYACLPMKVALETVLKVAKCYCENWASRVVPPPSGIPAPADPAKFDAHHFWTEVEKNLKPNDILLADQGTSASTCCGIRLPKGCTLISQLLWGSIGSALPMTLGAQLAHPDRRVVLVVGDGASEMTFQELGTFVRNGLKPIVFLLNNDGYVIERVIHGWNEPYNDISTWDYCAVMKGLSRGKADTEVLNAVGSTAAVLQKPTRDQMIFREVILGRHEVPVIDMTKH